MAEKCFKLQFKGDNWILVFLAPCGSNPEAISSKALKQRQDRRWQYFSTPITKWCKARLCTLLMIPTIISAWRARGTVWKCPFIWTFLILQVQSRNWIQSKYWNLIETMMRVISTRPYFYIPLHYGIFLSRPLVFCSDSF